LSLFTPEELEYLQSQRLGRMAAAGPDHQPHVVPVRFRYNPDTDTIDIGGHQFAKRDWGSGRDARAGRSQTPNSGQPTDVTETRR
jgi:nitroimidazol reductase NimA-like FMN-containing flavoprotein (pyridoxamine 5'-phosphate oxidase superfamily)